MSSSILPQRNLRLIPRSATSLDSTSGSLGEIFYDSTNNALRLFNGSTPGGTLIGPIVSGSPTVTAEQVQDIAAGLFTGSHTGISVSYNDPGAKLTLNVANQSWSQITGKPTLFSGSYTDLTNKPVLFSGSYTDLTNKPTIPSLTGYATETFVTTRGYLTTVGTISYTDLSNKPTIPTNTNQLTNGAGFITSTGIPSQSGNTGKYLTTDGTSVTWGAVSGIGTTTNALTVSTGLALDSGTTFNGSAARTISLATVWANPQSPGNPGEVITNISVDVYGRVTGIGAGTPSINSFSSIYVGATGSPPSGGTIVSADSTSDILYLVAGNNISLSADSMADSITIAASFTGPAFRAFVATAQTITSGSQQKVIFGTETFDTNNNFTSSKFTPTVAGYYQLNSTVRIAGGSSTGEYMLVIWKNGNEYARGTNASGTEQGASFYSMQVSDIVYANGSTDYFEIAIQQGSGTSKDTTLGTNISYFSGCMVRGA